VVADAALAIVRRDPRTCTGRLLTDVEVLREEGVTDLSGYLMGDDEAELEASFFLPEATS
jgi:hypothetical protein